MNVKKTMVSIILFILTAACYGQPMDLENIRINYQKAVLDKKLCRTMIETLGSGPQSTLHLSYLGAFQSIWAKHTINPIAKLKTFKRGKKNIENAVIREPNNVEIRFVRLSVQLNSPSFLGYKTDIEEDRKFIQTNKKEITSAILKKMIAAVT